MSMNLQHQSFLVSELDCDNSNCYRSDDCNSSAGTSRHNRRSHTSLPMTGRMCSQESSTSQNQLPSPIFRSGTEPIPMVRTIPSGKLIGSIGIQCWARAKCAPIYFWACRWKPQTFRAATDTFRLSISSTISLSRTQKSRLSCNVANGDT